MGRRSESADNIDKHVGNKIRELRLNLGLSQGELAKALGVTYQQAHKYENGSNRISAGRLALIASKLNMPVAYFYEGVNENPTPDHVSDQQRLYLEVARNFRSIKNPRYQEAVSHVVRILAGEASS